MSTPTKASSVYDRLASSDTTSSLYKRSPPVIKSPARRPSMKDTPRRMESPRSVSHTRSVVSEVETERSADSSFDGGHDQKASHHDVEKNFCALKSLFDGVKEENDTLRRQCGLLKTENQALQETLNELDLPGLQAERESLLVKISAYEALKPISLDEHQAVCAEYQQKIQFLEGAHQEAIAFTERDATKIKVLQESLACHDREVQRLSEASKLRDEQHQQTVASLKDAYQKAESDCQELHRQLQKTKDAAMTEAAKSKDELDNLTSEKTQLKQSNDSLLRADESKTTTIARLLAERSALDHELTKLKRTSVESLDNLRKELHSTREKLRSSHEMMVKKDLFYRAANSQLEGQKRLLESKLVESISLQTHRDELDAQRQELNALHAVEVAALRASRGGFMVPGSNEREGEGSIVAKMDQIALANDSLEAEARGLIEKIRSLSVMARSGQPIR